MAETYIYVPGLTQSQNLAKAAVALSKALEAQRVAIRQADSLGTTYGEFRRAYLSKVAADVYDAREVYAEAYRLYTNPFKVNKYV